MSETPNIYVRHYLIGHIAEDYERALRSLDSVYDTCHVIGEPLPDRLQQIRDELLTMAADWERKHLQPTSANGLLSDVEGEKQER